MTESHPQSRRKAAVRALADGIAPEAARWRSRNAYFHAEDARSLRFLVPAGLRVLEIGCGTGDLLAALMPKSGVGIDLSAGMIAEARKRHPELTFIVGDGEDPEVLTSLGDPFDVIVLADTIGEYEDVVTAFSHLHGLCHRDTRVVIAYHSPLWWPILKLAEQLGLKKPTPPQNWLSIDDIASLLELADFEVVAREWRQLVPRRVLGLGPLINRFIAPLPIIRRFCVRNYVIVRSRRLPPLGRLSATVVIPCRNECGNIFEAVRRMPAFGSDLELIFVEGHSSDGTADEIRRVIAANPERDIKFLTQPGRGKGDAVRAGFEAARGDVLIILDADLTAPPEMLPRFYDALVSGRGEFINGTRLVYPLETGAMRFLNLIANRIFSLLFTWLIGQRYTDTLCGTKALTAAHYRRIAAGRPYFGDFDPFGDFDLILGSARLHLKVCEIPVRYQARTYGETQIKRFQHGWLLARMVVFAFFKLKAF
ncbi:MAG: glycosyltransferase [Alphaproteobacteria bacterium]